MIVDDIKKLLNGSIDEKLEIIEKRTRERLRVILGRLEVVPTELEYIVADVTLKRFNRIGNEGMSNYSQEGLSMKFPDSDFDEYQDEINGYLASLNKEENESYGKVRFL